MGTIVQSNSWAILPLSGMGGSALRRDHFGVKPFYYYFSGGIFVLRLKSRPPPAWVPRWLNGKSGYLTAVVDDPYHPLGHPETPPAHTATVSHVGHSYNPTGLSILPVSCG